MRVDREVHREVERHHLIHNFMKYFLQFFQSPVIFTTIAIAIMGIELNVAPVFLKCTGNPFNVKEISVLGFLVVYTVSTFFLLPLGINQIFLKETFSNICLILPENKKRAVLFIFMTLLLLVPALVYIKQLPAVKVPYTAGQANSLASFVFVQIFILPPYYFAEEFFFRGFLFMQLWRKIKWHSFWITELLFAWVHLSKPFPEIIFSFPAGIALNYLALQTKSIYPPALVHYVLAVLFNIMIKFF